MVLWIIGLSGVGKTTLARQVVESMRRHRDNVVLLDGDVIRALFPAEVDHTVAGRRRNAERLSALSKFLSDQGIHVVAAVLSIFPDWQEWNRRELADYTEVYLKASVDTLARRDIKNLYGPARRGEIPNVVGIDIAFPEPARPDLVIDNEADRGDLGEFVERVLALPAVQQALAAR
jgi:adenylylsulfate kinase-like enzyme